ncbi:MAG TPA: XRE family transcriptional regulator [Haloplasmataceae bacterium]
MSLHERLVNLRKMHGYTQQKVAEALGISRGAYGNYETGKREPDTETLSALAELYGVSVDFLLGRTDNPAPPSTRRDIDRGTTIGKRLKQLREERQLTLRQLAQVAHVSHSFISDIEQGRSNPSIETLKALARALGVSLTDLTDDPTPAERGETLNIPIVGKTHGGLPIWAEECIEGWITLPQNALSSGKYFALHVEDESMSPMIPEGSLIIVHQQPSVENGKIAVVLWDGEYKAHVRRVYVDEAQKLVILQAINPAYPPITVKPNKVRILGLVKKVLADLQTATIIGI